MFLHQPSLLSSNKYCSNSSTSKHEKIEKNFTWQFLEMWHLFITVLLSKYGRCLSTASFFISIQRMSFFLNGPKTIVKSMTISLYMCHGNHIHILNCKKTTTKGGSTSIFKSDCIVLVSTILSILSWFPPK